MSLVVCNFITAVCLVIQVIYALTIIVRIFASPRKNAVSYLRNFKKGRFAIIYVATLPLYIVAFMYADYKFSLAFFSALAKMVDLIVLKYNYNDLSALLNASQLFDFTLHLSFILVAFNALLFTLSLVHQHLSNSINYALLKYTHKPRLYIFGEQPENIDIYFSDKVSRKVMIGDLDEKEKEELYYNKIFYHKENNYAGLVQELVKSARRAKVNVVINELETELNLKLCRYFNDEIAKVANKDQIIHNLSVFVFGEPEYEEIYLDEVSLSSGCLRYVDKYRQIAINFIDKFPLSNLLKPDMVDYKTAFIDNDVDLNVIFVGFGKINRQIFLTSVANNQFLTKVNGKIRLKPVDYYVIDKNDCSDKNLNHNYYRYKSVYNELNQEDYLPLPDMPANEFYYSTDVNSPEFYKRMKQILLENKKSLNVIVVSLGNELENLDVAKKLCSKINEWEVSNYNVFVKNKTEPLGSPVAGRKNAYYIGNETQIYDMNNLIGDKMSKMAIFKCETYVIENEIKKCESFDIAEEMPRIKRMAVKGWLLSKTQAERESSIYSCLSLRTKLNLIGLDYCEKSDPRPALTEKEYFDIYAKGDMPVFVKASGFGGRKIVRYDVNNYVDSLRKNLAILEHFRWNSYMITQGFIPASKKAILTEKTLTADGQIKFTNGKNYLLRHHGNLTTFEGLEEFSSIISKRDKISKESADVISYDYQIMDDAYWFVEQTGMKIVKKN